MKSQRSVAHGQNAQILGLQRRHGLLLAATACAVPVLALLVGVSLPNLALLSLALVAGVLLLTASKKIVTQALVVAIVWIPPPGLLSDTEMSVAKATALLGLALVFRTERTPVALEKEADDVELRPRLFLVVMLIALITWVASVAIGTGTLLNAVLMLSGAIGLCVVVLSSTPSMERGSIVGPAYLAAVTLTMIGDFALYFTGRGFDTGENAGRFAGSLGDYELLGQFYAIACVLALGLFLTSERGLARFMYLGIVIVAVFLLFQTQSRSSLVLAFLGMMIVLGLATSSWRGRRSRASRTIALAVVGIPVIVWPAVSDFAVFERFDTIRFGESLPVLLNRASVWQYFPGLQSFQQAGWHGNGLFYPYDQIGTFPHSLYLYLIWTIGWVGVIIFVVTILLLLIYSLRASGKSRQSPWTQLLVVSLSLSLVEQVKIEMTREPSSEALFWLIAIVLAASVTRERALSEVRK